MRPADQTPASLSSDSLGGRHLPMAVLRQYVAGTLPAAEQHRVETHTLACPRCADVLEGLSQTDLPTTDHALTKLQTRLRARIATEAPQTAPVVPLWPWRQIAAAVLVLLVSTAVWLGVRRTTEGPTAASQVAMRQTESQPDAASGASPGAASSMEQNKAEAEMTDNAIASAPAPLKREQAQASTSRTRARLRPRTRQQVAAAKEAPTSVTLSGTGADAGASAASAVIADASRGADTAQLARSNKAPADEQKAYARSAAASKAKRSSAPETAPAAPTDSSRLNSQIVAAVPAPAGMRMVRGRVTDRSSGTALPGVTVTAKGTAVGTSTTADGSFVLLVPKSVETLTFSYIGFKSSEQRISPTDSTVALALVPDSQPLNEVVVVRREPPPAPMSIGALPAGGYKAFQEYLEQELEYPEKALKEGKEGTVKLKFVVAADGSLQDIKVVRGLSEECDAEAIRLLKEGPKWYPAIVKGRRAARPVEVNVPFRVNQ